MITRTAWVDDDGSGTTGTVVNNAEKTTLYDQIDGRWSEVTTTLIGSQNNLAFSEADTIRCNNASTLTLTGLTAPAAPAKPAKRLIIISIGAGAVVLANEDVNSLATSRIITGIGSSLDLEAGKGYAVLVYDDVSDRWRVVGTSAGWRPATSTITTTGTQTALAITAGGANLIIFANNASLLTIQGIAAGADGQQLTIYSIGAGQVLLAHQNVSATAANRLVNFATSGDTPLAAGSGSATYQYDSTAARWRLLQHEQGAWITPTFAAGDFTGNGSMTWTLAAGDRTFLKYRLAGRTIQVAWELATTTVGGTVSTGLIINSGQWGGFTSAGGFWGPNWAADNGGAGVGGMAQIADTRILLYRDFTFASNWTSATDATSVRGGIAFEVT